MTDPQFSWETAREAAISEAQYFPRLQTSRLDEQCQEAAIATPNDAGLTDYTPIANLPGGLLESALPQPVPDASMSLGTVMPTLTPDSRDMQRQLISHTATRHVLSAPLASQLPANPVSTAKFDLRLPSFEALGIAAPHPDRKGTALQDPVFIGAGPLSKPSDPLHLLSPYEGEARGESGCMHPYRDGLILPSAEIDQKHITQYVSTFTPPDESAPAKWPSSYAHVTTAAMESPAQSDPEKTTPTIPETSRLGSSAAQRQREHLEDPQGHLPDQVKWLNDATQAIRQ